MTARELYALAVRLGGLTFWVFAVFDFTYALRPIAGLPLPMKYPAKADAMFGVMWFVLGLILTLIADPLSRLVYRRKP
jgi:hypothetical protein